MVYKKTELLSLSFRCSAAAAAIPLLLIPPAAAAAAADIGNWTGASERELKIPEAAEGGRRRCPGGPALPRYSSFGDPPFSFMPLGCVCTAFNNRRRCCVVVKLLLLVLVMSYACFHLSLPPRLLFFLVSFIFYLRMTLQLIFYFWEENSWLFDFSAYR